MQEISFMAMEYQQDQSIKEVQYRYFGSPENGWRIERDNAHWLDLGPGYVLVESQFCGICSTDLVRHQLPFDLPQITGHEVVGKFNNMPVVIEINASHKARGLSDTDCDYCNNELDIHCPERMTLGIDRLPGGFAKWMLVPVNAVHALPTGVNPKSYVLIEPFAAAYKAVETACPTDADEIAVLGPRRLGMLLIAALASYRQETGKNFKITAVMRHEALKNRALSLGADKVQFISENNKNDFADSYDIVFDTTGSTEGFITALSMATKKLHLKSTNGQAVLGLENLTAMVINEQCLLAFNETNLDKIVFSRDNKDKPIVYVSSELKKNQIIANFCDDSINIITEIIELNNNNQQVDAAIVTSLDEINLLTRPVSRQGHSLLKSSAPVLVGAENDVSVSDNRLLSKIFNQNLILETSRCGSFKRAIEIFNRNPELVMKLDEYLITQVMKVVQLSEAMKLAKNSDKSIKVVVETG